MVAKASSRGRRCVLVPANQQERMVLPARSAHRLAPLYGHPLARRSPSSLLYGLRGRGGQTYTSCVWPSRSSFPMHQPLFEQSGSIRFPDFGT